MERPCLWDTHTSRPFTALARTESKFQMANQLQTLSDVRSSYILWKSMRHWGRNTRPRQVIFVGPGLEQVWEQTNGGYEMNFKLPNRFAPCYSVWASLTGALHESMSRRRLMNDCHCHYCKSMGRMKSWMCCLSKYTFKQLLIHYNTKPASALRRWDPTSKISVGPPAVPPPPAAQTSHVQ